MSRNDNQHPMERKWLEGIIVGVCIALVVVLLQPLFARGNGWSSVLGLLVAAIVICTLQLAIFFWNKPRR